MSSVTRVLIDAAGYLVESPAVYSWGTPSFEKTIDLCHPPYSWLNLSEHISVVVLIGGSAIYNP